jgi:hypothetical protein
MMCKRLLVGRRWHSQRVTRRCLQGIYSSTIAATLACSLWETFSGYVRFVSEWNFTYLFVSNWNFTWVLDLRPKFHETPSQCEVSRIRWSQTEISHDLLVSEWNVTWLLGLRVKRHVTAWSQTDISRDPFVSEWNVTCLFVWLQFRTIPWSQSETSRDCLVSEWNVTWLLCLRLKFHATRSSQNEMSHVFWSDWNFTLPLGLSKTLCDHKWNRTQAYPDSVSTSFCVMCCEHSDHKQTLSHRKNYKRKWTRLNLFRPIPQLRVTGSNQPGHRLFCMRLLRVSPQSHQENRKL